MSDSQREALCRLLDVVEEQIEYDGPRVPTERTERMRRAVEEVDRLFGTWTPPPSGASTTAAGATA